VTTLLLAICIVIVAWLTTAATALRSVSRIWLRHWVELQLRGAPSAELYLERPQRMLLAATTGVAATVFVAGLLIGAGHSSGWAMARSAVVFLIVLLVFGQLVPRAVARRWSTALVPVLLPGLRAAEIVLTPLVLAARWLTKPLRSEMDEPEDEAHHTREDLEELLREGALEGVGEQTELAIITGVVDFGRKTIAEVMTPRADVFSLADDVRGLDLAQRIAQAGYSRVPLYRESPEQIVGMIHAFDVLKAGDSTHPALRPVATARTTDRCNALLSQLLRSRRHLAVVHDEAGRFVGIVTLEDLLEELVGEIRDEHDEPVGASAATGAVRGGDAEGHARAS
jgi:putative hemolysin